MRHDEAQYPARPAPTGFNALLRHFHSVADADHNAPTDWETGSIRAGSRITVLDNLSVARTLIPAPATDRDGATGALRLSALALAFSLVAAVPAFAADACPAILNHRFQPLQDQKSQSLPTLQPGWRYPCP